MAQERVAILGGGLAGLTTAFQLSAPEQQGRYDITVYQHGWRLGGKCATGRNASLGDRVQEHGFHVFMGQYDNAFNMVQRLYKEAAYPPFKTWEEAFTPTSSVTLMEEVNGDWIPWVMETPVFPGTPGIGEPPTIWKRAIEILQWIEKKLFTHHSDVFGTKQSDPGKSKNWLVKLIDLILEIFGIAALSAGALLLRGVIDIIKALHPDDNTHKQNEHDHLAEALSKLLKWIEKLIKKEIEDNNTLRRLWIMIDFALTSAIGGLKDGLFLDPASNLERVNQLDYKNWLRSHGGDELMVESAVIRGLYDLIFAYPLGDWQGDGNVEAGTMFVSLMNTATYRGTFMWKFNTGTGDLVMGPMYEVLKKRGVKFEFFARVDELTPAADGNWISEIKIGRQVSYKNGTYNPLRTLPSGMRVWPDRPLYGQIKQGKALEKSGADLESHWTSWKDKGKPLTLKQGRDFDWAVLAIPPGAHPVICKKLMAQNPAWKAMVENIQTVATQSMQTWMNTDEAGLGWEGSSVTGAYDAVGLNTWADISEVLPTENWPAGSDVVSEQIACGPMPCPKFPPPKKQKLYPIEEQVKVDGWAKDFLDNHAWRFWPNRFERGTGPQDGTLKSIYNRANVDPSERYTLSVANSTKYRLRAADSGYLNLFLTGDWIQNGQNLGSFEATTVSGMLTSKAISGLPETIYRVDAEALSGRRKAASGPPVSAPFVTHGGMSTLPGPIKLDDVTMWAFLLKADRAKMENYCRNIFTNPSGGAVTVEPVGSHVMMTIVDISHGIFPEAEYAGWSSERELTLWVPSVRTEEKNGERVATHFNMAIPYIILNNPTAVTIGREVFGYWKQYGWLTVPGDKGNAKDQLTVDLFSTKVFGKDNQSKRNRIMTLDPVKITPSNVLKGIKSFDQAAKALYKYLEPDIEKWHIGPGLIKDLLEDMFKAQIPQLFLKQFRDITDTEQACYQAITQAMAHVKKFEMLPHLVEYDMVIEPNDSSPMATDFGIVPSQAILGTKLEFDMLITPGTTLWQA